MRLYHVLEGRPLLEWDLNSLQKNPFNGSVVSASGVCFSATRPTVFAATASNGSVFVFDLAYSFLQARAVLRIPAAVSGGKLRESGKVVALTGLAFNGKQRDLLSVCDATGKVYVWKLGNLNPLHWLFYINVVILS